MRVKREASGSVRMGDRHPGGNMKDGARKEHTHIPILEKCLHGRVVARLAG